MILRLTKSPSEVKGRKRSQLSRPLLLVLAVLILLGLPVTAACRSSDTSDGSGDTVVPTSTAADIDGTSSGSYLRFNQEWLEGLTSSGLDLEDVDEVFWHVFSQLPDQVTVYPTENYYYFILYVDGRQIWGNIRLPAGRRERGVLSFAYFEFRESPIASTNRFSRNKFFTDADGLRIEELDPFTYVVRYNGKAVTFNLKKISQEPPRRFTLGQDEVFVERTFDESGFQFFLLFNEAKNFFFWVLNEEEIVPDTMEFYDTDLVIGKRSGFAFWVDEAHNNRKILAGILGQNATRNNYYDGPFDQLADNYVDEVNIYDYLILASPSLEGRIDKYGYFTDTERPSRVSISTYYIYWSQDSIRQFLGGIRAAEDPYLFISRRGVLDEEDLENSEEENP